jgi:hypothetical protein
MGKAVGRILGGGSKPKTPKVSLPPVEKPTPMPDEEAIKLAKQKEAAMKFRGKGSRQDTILTMDDGDNL